MRERDDGGDTHLLVVREGLCGDTGQSYTCNSLRLTLSVIVVRGCSGEDLNLSTVVMLHCHALYTALPVLSLCVCHSVNSLPHQGKEDIQCGCENASVVYLRPHPSPDTRGRITMLQRDYALAAEPIIDSVFYFDFTIRGIKAAA